MNDPVIIEVAVNGGTTKATNPNVPITPEEIAADALACFDAGAAIVHAHASPPDGTAEELAERYLTAFRPVWAQRPDALIYPTLNYAPAPLRFEHLPILAKEGLRIGLLDPGSVNVSGVGGDGLPAGAGAYTNSYDLIRDVYAMHADAGLGPSLAMYEPGFLRGAVAFWRKGRLPAGSMFKFYLSEDRGLYGAPFGLPVTPTAVDAYLEARAECPVPWAVSAVGGDLGRSDAARRALERGGHLHIGLEFYGGDRTPTNVELVEEAVALCEEAGRPVATCAEAAEILGLPTR